MVFSTMLTDAFLLTARTEYRQIVYRTDGGLLNLRRLKAVTKVKEILFADDYMPLAVTQSR